MYSWTSTSINNPWNYIMQAIENARRKQKMIKLSAMLKRYYKLKYSELSVWYSKSEESILRRLDASREVPTYLMHIPSSFK